ncbi:MAG: secretion protein, partial [Fluviicola sp.]
CDSYTWIDGNTYTASNNSATFTLTNVAGCDSVVTLDLTMNNSTTGTDIQTACDSYTWIDGNTYTTSNNTSTFTLTNAAGCDSVVTLDLTILSSSTGTDVQTACDSYTWIDGNTYTASNNSATSTLTNTVGCDSLVTLDLTILNSSTGTDVQTACDSYTWIDGNTYTASNNSATFTLTNAEGCDSIVTLDLTINTVDISVSNTSLTLTANETGASYQWLDCDNNYAAIPGETNQEFTATANGSYAVELTVNNCTDTSTCQIISDVSINEETKGSIVVYPNPTNGLIQIESASSIIEVKIFNLQGALVYETNKSTLHLEGLNNGLYLVRVNTKNGSFERKIIKK